MQEVRRVEVSLRLLQMPGMRDGHRNDCIKCNLPAQATRRWADPEANRARVREWQLANPERVKAKHAEYRADGRKSISNRKSHLKRKYSMTINEYDEMLGNQGGGCAICGRPPRPDISLHVDHDHKTGQIRGLLASVVTTRSATFSMTSRCFARPLATWVVPPTIPSWRTGSRRALPN